MFDIFRKNSKAVLFIIKFLAIYGILSILYSFYIKEYQSRRPPRPDAITHEVTEQAVFFMNLFGMDVTYETDKTLPYVNVNHQGITYISVYEGCNGIAIMILFLSFIIAFGGPLKHMAWYAPLSLLLIHLANLGRLVLLLFVAKDFPESFYFVHKFLFTAIIYAAIFLLWVIWVRYFVLLRKKETAEV